MSLSDVVRQQVRVRANFACEYCLVQDAAVGSEQTIDHFRPKSKGGTDELANLVYCCVRCNTYKGNY